MLIWYREGGVWPLVWGTSPVYLSSPSPPPSSGIWVLMLQEATSSLQSYWAKGEDEAWEKYLSESWQDLGDLVQNHWIVESFKIKAWNWPSCRNRHSNCTLYALQYMHCHTQAQQDHILPAHLIIPAIGTTLHLHVILLHWRSGPHHTGTLHSGTCSPSTYSPHRQYLLSWNPARLPPVCSTIAPAV